RLILRDIVATDAESIFEGLSHPEVIRYYGVSFQTLQETMGQMKWYKELEQNQTGKWWAICDKQDGTFFGGVGFNDWTQEHRKAEIGYWLLPRYWGKGIVSEAVPAACDYAMKVMKLHRIEAYIEPLNTQSIRLIEKLGFQHEGTMIDCEVKDGAFIDFALYALLDR
ncbi:MAG: GNAT family N-acetyltransferase, partial [Bacteroidota bacterium]